MKNIIKRKLPLDKTYTLLDKKYVSLVDGFGCNCGNIGNKFANIATITDGKSNADYLIGQRIKQHLTQLKTWIINKVPYQCRTSLKVA